MTEANSYNHIICKQELRKYVIKLKGDTNKFNKMKKAQRSALSELITYWNKFAEYELDHLWKIEKLHRVISRRPGCKMLWNKYINSVMELREYSETMLAHMARQRKNEPHVHTDSCEHDEHSEAYHQSELYREQYEQAHVRYNELHKEWTKEWEKTYPLKDYVDVNKLTNEDKISYFVDRLKYCHNKIPGPDETQDNLINKALNETVINKLYEHAGHFNITEEIENELPWLEDYVNKKNEPEVSDNLEPKVNDGQMMELTGNDKLITRQLYKEESNDKTDK